MSRPVRVAPPRAGLSGGLDLPGDKSIAHRALLLGALAEGTTVVRGVPGGADVQATRAAVQRLGAHVREEEGTLHIEGQGAGLGVADRVAIDCANSGTTMRLGAGLVAGGPGTVVLDGDASLRRRPMERVAEPLRAMHAVVETTAGRAPVTVRGGSLLGVDWRSPVASAQVKSAILLAGLRAAAIPLPGDVSSAAFLVVAGLLVPGSTLRLRDVGLNPTRTGFLAILRRMGASVDVIDPHDAAGEPRGELHVRATTLHGTTITPEEVPAAIDELPILAVAAALAEGETVLRGASELRVKESDRIAALEQLRPLGVTLQTTPDGFVIRGTGGRRLRGGRIDAGGDHRVAMAFAVAGLVADGGVEIRDPECVDVSFPGFFTRLVELGAEVTPR